MNFMYSAVARFLASSPRLTDRLLARAKRTPYQHILSRDGTTVYMRRWWLFNPTDYKNERRYPWLPVSIRFHEIMRPDDDPHLHDHPWNARTLVLRGWYSEVRENGKAHYRSAGTSARLNHGEFHRIVQTSYPYTLTLFITFGYRGDWGFLVDGKKVPWRDYLGVPTE